MTARIIDGKALSSACAEGFKQRVGKLVEQGLQPGLAVILVGDNPASRVYVSSKVKACESAACAPSTSPARRCRRGRSPRHHRPPQCRPGRATDQLPLPSHIDNRNVLEAISVHKDVDGFHLYNVGGLVVGSTIFPPTPYGVQLLLDTTGTDVAGRNVVVVGASIVGKRGPDAAAARGHRHHLPRQNPRPGPAHHPRRHPHRRRRQRPG